MLNNPILSTDLNALTGVGFIAALIKTLIAFSFIVGSVIFVFMIIMGGIKWISAGGDKAQLEAARSKVTHAIIGLFVLFSTYAIISLIQVLFGTNLLLLDLSVLKL